MKFLSRKSKTTVGLDIGSSYVKVVEIDHSKSEPILKNYAVVKLPPEAIVEGEIMDRSLVIEGIQSCMSKAGVARKDVVTAVSGRAVIVKKIVMDKMNPDDAKEAIFWKPSSTFRSISTTCVSTSRCCARTSARTRWRSSSWPPRRTWSRPTRAW